MIKDHLPPGPGRQTEDDSVSLSEGSVFLKIAFDFEEGNDTASFFFSDDGRVWKKIGTDLRMIYTLDLFIGYRIGLFCYPETETGGYADFRNFIADQA